MGRIQKRARARHAPLADTALQVAIRRQPTQHCAVLVLREVTLLLVAAKRLIAMVEQQQSPVFALREVSRLLAEPTQAHRQRAPHVVLARLLGQLD